MSDSFSIDRDSIGPLQFEGMHVAELSTVREWKERWTEFDIWRTNSDKYVTRVVGCSDVEGEVDRIGVRVHDTAVQCVKSFCNKSTGHFSTPAIDLLEAAANKDGGIADVLEQLREPEVI